MVHLQELHERHADEGLVVLGFNCADKQDLAKALLAKKGVTFDIAYRGYKLSGVPLNYVIDRRGRVVDAWYGFRKNDPRLQKALARLQVR